MIATSRNRPELHAGWEAVLDSDERLIWKGRSDGAVVWTPTIVAIAFAGFLMIAISLFILHLFLSIVPFSGSPFFSLPFSIVPYMLTMFCLIQMALGIYIIVGPSWLSAYKRKRGLYILTNRRAIIMTDIPLLGKRVRSHSIDEDTILEFDLKDPGSIYFLSESEEAKSLLAWLNSMGAGFVRIPDAAHVYRLLRSVQRGDA